MRRSSAPSKLGAKFNSPSIRSVSTKATVSAPVENATRTTESILGLIAKVKQSGDSTSNCASPDQFTKSFDPQESTSFCNEQVVNKQTSEIVISKRIFNVVFGKPSKKKHKTWEGDGTLEVGEQSLTLKDSEGIVLGRGSGKKNSELEEGSRLFVGNKEVEIIDAISSPDEVPLKRPLESVSPKPPRAKKAKVSKPAPVGILPRPSAPHHLQDFQPLTMPQPDLDHQWQFNASGAPVSLVSVDPSLLRVLRPHQREGVVFLYRCITGLRDPHHTGAILADEMGLGKTLQTITLIWTLLRHAVYGREPLLRKVLIVTPSSLACNWYQEFQRWLGHHRIHIFTVDQKNKPRDFLNLPNVPVMIISYEMFVRCYNDVVGVAFDLVICDEGHRLKNNSVKAYSLLSQLPCQRRILLTGTPIQNDLQEFHALVDLVNPNILESYEEFRNVYENSIVASRQPELPDDVKAQGEDRAQALARLTAGFVLRRTHAILDKYLPGKHEVVLFCKPSNIQAFDNWQHRREDISEAVEKSWAERGSCGLDSHQCGQALRRGAQGPVHSGGGGGQSDPPHAGVWVCGGRGCPSASSAAVGHQAVPAAAPARALSPQQPAVPVAALPPSSTAQLANRNGTRRSWTVNNICISKRC